MTRSRSAQSSPKADCEDERVFAKCSETNEYDQTVTNAVVRHHHGELGSEDTHAEKDVNPDGVPASTRDSKTRRKAEKAARKAQRAERRAAKAARGARRAAEAENAVVKEEEVDSVDLLAAVPQAATPPSDAQPIPPAHAPHGLPQQPAQRTTPAKYNTGRWDDAEKTAVIKTMESIQNMIGLDNDAMHALVKANPKRSSNPHHPVLWDAIEAACPTRARQKLIDWLRNYLANRAGHGKWSKEDDKQLLEMVRVHGTQWTKIAAAMGRHVDPVRDRYRNYLVCGDKIVGGTWSAAEENKLFEAVEQAIGRISQNRRSQALSDADILGQINWHQISEGMGRTRSRLQCSEKWKRLCARAAIPDTITAMLPSGSAALLVKPQRKLRSLTGKDKYRLLRAIYESGARSELEVPWNHILTHTFHDLFQRQALEVAWGRLRPVVPQGHARTTAECAKYHLETYKKWYPSSPSEKSQSKKATPTNTSTTEPTEPIVGGDVQDPEDEVLMQEAREEQREQELPARNVRANKRKSFWVQRGYPRT